MSVHASAFHNDRVLPLEEVPLSPGQAGLFNGWGLFTTMRIYAGQPFAFERHWQRLCTDAERVRLPLPLKDAEVRGGLEQVIAANHVREGCARIYFCYNKVGYWHSDGTFPTVDCLIYTTDLPIRPGAARLSVQECGRFSRDPLVGTKTTSWLGNAWRFDTAQRDGFDEVLLLNERDEVAECTSANLFCVQKGVVRTPPIASGCLPGVTRTLLLEMGTGAGVRFEEETMTLENVLSSEEVFITSTTRELQPVRSVGDRSWKDVPGPVTRALADAFKVLVRSTRVGGQPEQKGRSI